MLKLIVVFEDAAGKPHRWSYNEPDPNKSPEEIRALLEAMTQLNLFEKNGVKQFQKVVSAKFVETINTPLFDASKQLPETSIADTNNVFATQINYDEVSTNQTEPVEAIYELPSNKDTKDPDTVLKQSKELENVINRSATNDAQIQRPVNQKKVQVDRVRAYHEARKKKKGKKKRS